MGERSRNDRIRASDAERSRVAAWLAAAFEEGRLDLAEFDRRTGAAYSAVTRGDLVPLTDDLPEPESALERTAAPRRPPAPAKSPPPPDRGSPWLLWMGLVMGGLCMARGGWIWPVVLILVAIPAAGLLRWICDDPFGRGRSKDRPS